MLFLNYELCYFIAIIFIYLHSVSVALKIYYSFIDESSSCLTKTVCNKFEIRRATFAHDEM